MDFRFDLFSLMDLVLFYRILFSKPASYTKAREEENDQTQLTEPRR